ncbi:hypothetical protein AWC38_SpisGene3229 [Stylophora pistillata]|uniref:Mutator-like transposase domain-containing protein n=1 Tax=Stylophora pistillata TaxID=50429 RepID=A0A2B4SPV0_STYPI|nr:hypothetical protein AWC38_SpisGene3229 [Stylophora pistillata]
MPGSVAALKKENNILKAQLSSMSDEVARLKELIQRHSDRSEEVLPSEEGAQCVEFLSKKYDDFHLFSGMAKDELQRLSAKLEELKAMVDIIGNAIDEFQEHSFQYNVKIVGVPERLQDESAASISKLCLNILKKRELTYRCNVNLIERSIERFGISSSLFAKCHECGMEEFMATGEHDGDQETPRTIRGKDINRRIVYAAFEMGNGREGVAKLCGILNMPFNISIDTWYNHEEILHAAHDKVTKEQLKANENEAKQVAIDGGTSRNDNSFLLLISVTFDCTWSKRSITANHCAGLACKDKPHHLDAVFKEPLLKIYERLRMVANAAALHFSCGATKKHSVMREAGLVVGHHTNRASERRDSGRVKQAVARVQEKHKKYRLARKQARVKEEELRVRREGMTYEAGSFNDIATLREPQ